MGKGETLREGWNLLDKTNAPVTKLVDGMGNYVDLGIASETFSAQVFGKEMQENIKDRDFAEAATEGTLFLANSAISAFNSVMSDPNVNAEATNWVTGTGGNLVRFYDFTSGAIDSLNAAHSFAEHTVNAHEILDNINNKVELQKALSKQHKKSVDKLKIAKAELTELKASQK